MYITGMVVEDYKGRHILMNGCKYLTPNGKSLVHLYAKSMHKLYIKSVSFIIFKKWYNKTTISIQIFLLIFIGSKFTQSNFVPHYPIPGGVVGDKREGFTEQRKN